MPTYDQAIVWIIVGLIGGSLAGLIIKWDRHGFGLARNLAIGLLGALIGGFLFRWLEILPELDKIAISLRDVVSALAGSLLVLAVVYVWSKLK